MVLGFQASAWVVVFYGLLLLLGLIAKRATAKQKARERSRLIGLDRYVNEVALVQTRRKQLEPRHQVLRRHREKLLAALDDFKGTRAHRDFEARLEKVNAAYGELSRAYKRLSELEAELWMRRAAFGLVRRVQQELRKSPRLSMAEVKSLRARIERIVRHSVDREVRRLLDGSRARAILDEAQEKIREHLAALRLRELDASLAQDAVGTEHLDALVVEEAVVAGFEEEMRELDAMTEAVLEVERMLEAEPGRLTDASPAASPDRDNHSRRSRPQ